VKQIVDVVRFQSSDDRLVNRGDCTRMASGEGNEVFIGLFDRAEPLAQMRKRLVLEGDHSSHLGQFYARDG
jgi:hypothetical protein